MSHLLFVGCRNMTEVFAGLPEQDVLLAEFLLEKFLRRQTRVGIRPQTGGGSLSPPLPQQQQQLHKKQFQSGAFASSVGAERRGRAGARRFCRARTRRFRLQKVSWAAFKDTAFVWESRQHKQRYLNSLITHPGLGRPQNEDLLRNV